jgi:short-subunit dehydrogenase
LGDLREIGKIRNLSEDEGMRREVRDRRWLITGASRGIGKGLAEQAAAAGARVALAARSADKLEALARQLKSSGADVLAVPADVTSEEDRRRVLGAVADHFGGLDVLVNNAGVASWGHFADSSEAVLRQVMDVNFFAAAEMTRLAVPLLVRGRQPAIVNVGSLCGRRGLPAWPEHSASKFALCGLTEALRGEMARFDIDVLLVLPGLTRSDLASHLLRNEGRAKINFDEGMPPEAVAEHIMRVVRKNRTETAVGSDARWMLLVNKFFPRLVDWLIARRIRKLYAAP